MAYVPPHKRQSNNYSVRPSPLPDSLLPRFKKHRDFRNFKPRCSKPARQVSWFPVRSTSGTSTDVFSCVSLQPVSHCHSDKNKIEKVLILVSLLSYQVSLENHEETKESPGVVIMEKVKKLLFASLENIRKENLPHVKSTLVVRVGKNLFLGSPFRLKYALQGPITVENMKKLGKIFYTSLPASYLERVLLKADSNAVFKFIKRKEIYRIKFSDNRMPGVIINCKCSIQDGNKISLYKAKIEPAREVIFDISCLDKHLDLRLKLSSRTVLTDLTDVGMAGYKELIDSVIIDPNSDGGLRFPVVYPSSYENRYEVRCVWHTRTTIYGAPSLKLLARHADRFDIRTGFRKVSEEVYFKLNGIVSKFQEEVVDEKLASDMLKDSIGLIWNNFLC